MESDAKTMAADRHSSNFPLIILPSALFLNMRFSHKAGDDAKIFTVNCFLKKCGGGARRRRRTRRRQQRQTHRQRLRRRGWRIKFSTLMRSTSPALATFLLSTGEISSIPAGLSFSVSCFYLSFKFIAHFEDLIIKLQY